MNIVGQYFAADVKSTKTRIRHKDKIDRFDAASWGDYDVRTQRRLQLEKRLSQLRMQDNEIHTPVFKNSTPITNWVGVVAADQDNNEAAKAKAASDAYRKNTH